MKNELLGWSVVCSQSTGRSKMSETNVALSHYPYRLTAVVSVNYKTYTVVSVVLYTHQAGMLKMHATYQLIISLNIFLTPGFIVEYIRKCLLFSSVLSSSQISSCFNLFLVSVLIHSSPGNRDRGGEGCIKM